MTKTLGVKQKDSNFTIFCLNIANPSLERAAKQVKWLRRDSSDVYVLTECKGSNGCALIEDHFLSNGYDVIFPNLRQNEYGVMIASKHELYPTTFSNEVKYLTSRVVSVGITNSEFDFEVIGVYVPSRGTNNIRREKKRRFISSLCTAFKNRGRSRRTIFCGDLNVVEPNHIPHYSVFEPWEYSCYDNLRKFQLVDVFRHLNPNSTAHSWFGRVGNGYRYDHCFVSKDLLADTRTCFYSHEPRKRGLTDHAAIITNLVTK